MLISEVTSSRVTPALAILEKYLGYLQHAENKSPKTVENRRHILGPFLKRLGKESVQDISIHDVDRYWMERGQEVKPSSLNSEKQAVRSLFAYCQAHLLMETQFDFRIIRRQKERPPRVIPLPPELVADVVASTQNEQLKLIITVLFETGMRIGELLNLTVQDIHGTQIQVRGKGSKDRVVFMPQGLARALRNFCIAHDIYSGHVFRPVQKHANHPTDRYVSAYAVRDRIQREFARFGVKMHPHQLRHSYAVNWVQKGGDIRTLQLILGHDSLETTQRYLGFGNKYIDEVVQRIMPQSIMQSST